MPTSSNAPMFIILGIILFVGIYVIANYNTMVRLKNYCREAWSGIDTELKRRYDLIPNLVETVKGYAHHEQETFTRVVEARSRAIASSGSISAQAASEKNLVDSLKQLLAVSERYPDLKASTNFLALQRELANTEDRIQAARRFYNANVRDLNTRIQVFPSNILANMFGFTEEEYFEVEEASVRNAVQVAL